MNSEHLVNLPANLVKRVISFEETDSTNSQARALVSSGQDWAHILLRADFQTAGRGRLNRRWSAPRGKALLATLVLPAHQLPPNLGVLSLSTAICLAIRGHKCEAVIKYPNDIVCEGRKIAGILGETASSPDGQSALVLGFGVNVAQTIEDFPADMPYAASSIFLETGSTPPRDPLLSTILHNLAESASTPDTIVQEYKSLCSTIGALVTIDIGTKTVTGTVLDIDSDGCLILQEPGSGTQRLQSTQIVRIHRP